MSLRSRAGTLTYADGTVFSGPVLGQSHNGWIYKPDELRTPQEIRSGKNKSWPRGEGREKGNEYVQSVLQDHFESRKWEKPAKATQTSTSPAHISGDSLTASWNDPTFGWTTCSISIVDLSRRSENPPYYSITWRLSGNELMVWLLKQRVDNDSGVTSIGATVNTHTEPPEFVKEFIKDPFRTTVDRITADLGYETGVFDPYFDPPEELKDGDYKPTKSADWYNDVVVHGSYGNGLFYKQGVIEEIFQSEQNWDALQVFFDALSFLGFRVNTSWTAGSRGWNDKSLSGITVVIPEQGDMHRHVLRFEATNPHVDIDCGYVEDDARWLDRKQREATEQMAELERALETFDFEIDMEGKNDDH